MRDLDGGGCMAEMRYLRVVPLAVIAVLGISASASGDSAPHLAATVQKATAHKPYPRAGALTTVAFTVGEPGAPSGSGVSSGSAFDVQLVPNTGVPTTMTPAAGQNGRYHATIRWAGGRIRRIRIGGFLNAVPSIPQGGFWLPVKVLRKNF